MFQFADNKLVIAAIGEAGEGKSTLLNLILNTPGEDKIFFDVSDEPEACTVTPVFRCLCQTLIALLLLWESC